MASRFAVGFGALAIGLVGFAGTASADLGAGNINPDTKGSIIIHKQESGSQTSGPGSVTGDPNPGGTPVADVTFTVYKVNDLDLTTQAAWDGLSGATVSADCSTLTVGGATYTTTKAAEVITGVDGSVTAGDLAVGGYTVCETAAPSTVQKKAAPFFVTIPYPNGASGWLYNVHVYPKNTVVLAPTKGIDVTANGLQTGAQVSFPVTVTVPSIAEGEQFDYFIVSDPLDTALTEGAVASVTMDGTAVDSSYYTVTTGQTVNVGFTKAGLAWLKTQPTKQIVVTFTAKVNSTPEGGVIPNTANLYVNATPGDNPPDTPPVTPPDNPPTPPTPTNKVIQTWGAAQIVKQDKDNQAKLSGATFEVYNAQDPYAADCSTSVKTGAPISVGGATTFTTDANGIAAIAGLFVDSEVGAAGQETVTPDHTQRCYVLVETAAPAGYVLPANPDTPLTVVAGNTATASSVTIDNTKQNVPGLPLTGGSGQVVMLTGGAVMIAAAGALVLARRRRVEA